MRLSKFDISFCATTGKTRSESRGRFTGHQKTRFCFLSGGYQYNSPIRIYIYITSYTYIDVTCLYIHPQHTQFFFRNPLGFILLKRAPLRFLVHTAAPPLRPEESTCRRWPNTFVKSWLSTSVPSWSPLRRRRRFGVSNAKTVGWSLVGNGKVWGGGMTETGETFPEKTYIDICVNIYIYT